MPKSNHVVEFALGAYLDRLGAEVQHTPRYITRGPGSGRAGTLAFTTASHIGLFSASSDPGVGTMWWSTRDVSVTTSDPLLGSGAPTTRLEAQPFRIALGPDGNLWFTEPEINHVGTVAAPGTKHDFSGVKHIACRRREVSTGKLSHTAGGYDIARGPEGMVWFTRTHSGAIGVITPPKSISELSGTRALPSPSNGRWDPKRYVPPAPRGWSSEARTARKLHRERLKKVAPTGEPYGLAVAPDGTLWVTERRRNAIACLSTPPEEFILPTWDSHPCYITAGPDGNLWFTESRGAIGRITPAGQITEFEVEGRPHDITAGPDGNLWFTDTSGFEDSIGRITPDGEVARFAVSEATCGITAGPDKRIWFTLPDAGAIGCIKP